MIISVASGKGGTGKTTIATNLALSVSNARLLDCDVEAPNSHIFIKPDITDKKDIFIPIPQVDESRCTGCGRCKEVCVYNAIAVLAGKVLVFGELCHGCGACSYFCPVKAIIEVGRNIGYTEIGSKEGLEFVHGKLKIGEPMAPPLIKAVKKYISEDMVNIIDAPPGTSCPVIAAINGSDFVVLVTEPTPFGLNDLVLAVEVLRKLRLPFGVVINRADLGNLKTEEYCSKENIDILMKIPFSKEIAAAYSKGISIVEALPEYKEKFSGLMNKITKAANETDSCNKR